MVSLGPSAIAFAIGNPDTPFERFRLDDLVDAPTGAPPGRLASLAHLAAKALDGTEHSEGALFATDTEFKAYQFRPLLKYLSSASKRLLIADEAGLGKTVEAGYIILEDIARHRAKRVLILCPAGLKHKWQAEMWRHFGLTFDTVSGPELAVRLGGTAPFRIIASFDSARSLRGRTAETGWAIDLLVIDEVHHMIGRTGEILRRKLGLAASKASRRVVALSATPIQLELTDLRRVLEVIAGGELSPTEFDSKMRVVATLNLLRAATGVGGEPTRPQEANRLISSLSSFGVPDTTCSRLAVLALETGRSKEVFDKKLSELDPFRDVVTRSRRREVNEFRIRTIEDHWVTLEDRPAAEPGEVSEAELFKEIDSFLHHSFTHVHRLQLSSSLPATVGLLRGGMHGFRVWVRGSNELSDLDRYDEDMETGARPYDKKLSPDERERAARLVDLSNRIEADSKWECLRLLLLKMMEERPRKAIVFTQWVPTLKYLGEKSMALKNIKAYATSGEDSEWQREKTVNTFKESTAPAVLFATDFLSEGVDLQYADTVVNYDLPTNPQRIEQRIGRVDRVGQESDNIEVHNLWTSGTLDEVQEKVVRARIRVFLEGIGDVTVVTGDAAKSYGRLPDQELEERRLGQLLELNSAGIFAAAEGFMDAQAYDLRSRQNGSLHRFWWAAVTFTLVRATGDIAIALDEGEYVRIGPMDERSVDVVMRWAGSRDAAFVESLLKTHLDGTGYITLSKAPGRPGLFCPAASPLTRTSLRITLNSLERQVAKTRPLVLRIVPKQGEPEEQVVICRYACESSETADSISTYWVGNGGKWSKATREQMIKVQTLLDFGQFNESVEEGPWEPPTGLPEHVRRDFEAWLQQSRGKAEGLSGKSEYLAIISPLR